MGSYACSFLLKYLFFLIIMKGLTYFDIVQLVIAGNEEGIKLWHCWQNIRSSHIWMKSFQHALMVLSIKSQEPLQLPLFRAQESTFIYLSLSASRPHSVHH